MRRAPLDPATQTSTPKFLTSALAAAPASLAADRALLSREGPDSSCAGCRSVGNATTAPPFERSPPLLAGVAGVST